MPLLGTRDSWRNPIHTSHVAVLWGTEEQGGEVPYTGCSRQLHQEESKSITVILAPRREHVIGGI